MSAKTEFKHFIRMAEEYLVSGSVIDDNSGLFPRPPIALNPIELLDAHGDQDRRPRPGPTFGPNR